MATIEPEETLSSEIAFAGRLLQVRRDTVRLPGGQTTELEVVVHPDVIGVIPILDDGRIVFVRQYRKAADRVLLEVPAGGIDGDETPEAAARREMIEETGYRVGTLQLLSTFYTSPGYTTEKMYLFRATDLQPGDATEETDQIEVVQLDLDEALRRARAGEMADAKTLLALTLHATHREGRPPQ